VALGVDAIAASLNADKFDLRREEWQERVRGEE
jgi:hypothetical protein